MIGDPRLILNYLNTRWTWARHRLKFPIEDSSLPLILTHLRFPVIILFTAYHDFAYSHLIASCIFGTLIARM